MNSIHARSHIVCTLVLAWLITLPNTHAAPATTGLPIIEKVDFQPFSAATRRLVEALDFAGAPLNAEEKAKIDKALEGRDPAADVVAIQETLDTRCLTLVHINPESRVKVHAGPAPRDLLQHGWRTFLVKVHNEPGVTAELVAESPNAKPVYKRSTHRSEVPEEEFEAPGVILDRFLAISMVSRQPLNKTLSGLSLEYRIIQLYSRDKGPREAKLLFNVGQGTQDLGFRNELSLLFQAKPAVKVIFDVIDFDGTPGTASFVIKDAQGNVYPTPSRRLAPDFFFHEQIYRHSGESVFLSKGTFEVEYTRGPEYLIKKRTIEVPDTTEHRETFKLERWIHTAAQDWWSGDHHIHAAGCAHYESPTQGVFPEAMLRHIMGEDLNVGCVLTWGPCWYFRRNSSEVASTNSRPTSTSCGTTSRFPVSRAIIPATCRSFV